MTNLVVVESPAKCKKIQSFLGHGWRVVATMGHLRELSEDMEVTQLQPAYQWIKAKSKAIQQLKEAAKGATTVYLAADDDREGEMIAYSVCVLLRLPLDTPRIVFHEITERAIQHAIQHPRRLDMNRVHAQETRAMMDRLIGFTISPLLWKYVAPTLSAGRCQTPALRLVVEREEQCEAFVSTTCWKMDAVWEGPVPVPVPSVMEDDLEDEDSIQAILEHAHTHPTGRIVQRTVKPWSEAPPEPLITSTLQQQMSTLYHCSPKQTMSIAQRLYEAGHITYMRTDHPVLSEEARQQAQQWVREHYGEEYVAKERPKEPSKPKSKKKAGKEDQKPQEQSKPKAQEAHEAIRPTHLERVSLDSMDWSAMDRKVYSHIWRRTLQSVMTPATGQALTLCIQLEDLEEVTWVARLRHTEHEGWRQVEEHGSNRQADETGGIGGGLRPPEEEEKQDDQTWNAWTALPVGTPLPWKSLRGYPKETTSQGRYTEASLVRELEKHGIGRPSTFASLLAVIQEKQYVEVKDIAPRKVTTPLYTMEAGQWPYTVRPTETAIGGEKRKLVPTALGRSVHEWAIRHFSDLFDYGFTGAMERQLDEVAEGNREEKEVLQETWECYRERYRTLGGRTPPPVPPVLSNSSSASNASVSSASPVPPVLSTSPASAKRKDFQGGLKAVQTKKGPLLLREGGAKTEFLGWPKGVSWDKMTEARAMAYEAETRKQNEPCGEWKGKPVYQKTGRYGTYLQCEGETLPFQEGESWEDTVTRWEKKATSTTTTATKPLYESATYCVQNGPYGPYIRKKSNTRTPLVSVPKDASLTNLTEEIVHGWYQSKPALKRPSTKQKKSTE